MPNGQITAGSDPWDGVEINPNHAYTCAELARKWNWHRDTVAKRFQYYPGVIFLNHQSRRVKDEETPGRTRVKRRYLILRVPGTVAMKWLQEHTRVSL
jgi:hypothetical protein